MTHQQIIKLFEDHNHGVIISFKGINEVFDAYFAQHKVMIKMDAIIHEKIKAEQSHENA